MLLLQTDSCHQPFFPRLRSCKALVTWTEQKKTGFLNRDEYQHLAIWAIIDRLRVPALPPPSFEEAMKAIDDSFDFTPKPFENGDVMNAAGTNNGSCKILSLGILVGLNKRETLTCFGKESSCLLLEA